MEELLFKEKSYQVIGLCMEVHRQLGKGFLEIVYKDALELEFRNAGISFAREKEYCVDYKGTILLHKFYADFVVFDSIILEIKAVKELADEHVAQTINYLKVAQLQLGLLVNFGEYSLKYKRIINQNNSYLK
jgi:GxxExxY protein